MPVFEIQSGGKTFEVEAPDQQSAVNGFKSFTPQTPAQPQPQKTGGAFAKPLAALSGAAQGATAGFADEIAALSSPLPFNLARAQQGVLRDKLKAENPKTSAGFEIGGAIGGLGKLSLARKAGEGAVKGIAKLGAEGGAFGVANALGNQTDVVEGGLFGVLGGAGGGALLGAGARALSPLFKGKKPNVPSTQDLLDGAKSTRKELKELGAEFSPEQVNQLAIGVGDDIATSGIDKVGGKVGKAARQIQKNADSPATFEQLDNLRKQIDLPVTASNSDKRLAGILRGHIDDFVTKVDPANGSGEGLGGLLDKSRDFTRRGRTAESLENAIEAAKTRTAKSGTGGNLDNNLRSEVDRVLKKQGKFLDKETKDRLEAISRGSKGQNLARSFGRAFSPTTGALQGAASGGAAVATGGLSIPLSVAGLAAKKGSEKTTERNIQELIRQIQAGSKSAAARPDTKVSKALGNTQRQQEIVRLLTAAGIVTAN